MLRPRSGIRLGDPTGSFRRYAGAPLGALPHEALARPMCRTRRSFTNPAVPHSRLPISDRRVFRCRLGLSAWKQYGAVTLGARGETRPSGQPCTRRRRCRLRRTRLPLRAARARARGAVCVLGRGTTGPDHLLVALTSMGWREAGSTCERALPLLPSTTRGTPSARFVSRRPCSGGGLADCSRAWSDAQLAALLGLDRDGTSATQKGGNGVPCPRQ